MTFKVNPGVVVGQLESDRMDPHNAPSRVPLPYGSMSHTAAYEAADCQAFTPALTWQKSSFCGASSANCVEGAFLENHILVRDTKGPAARVLGFSRARWSAFIEGLHSQP